MKHLISGNINKKRLRSKINNDCFSFIIEESVSSTNTVLKKLAEQGAPEYTVLISDFQTEGRGRLGRSFFSPPGTGIYMSILLRPDKSPEDSLLLTTCMAASIRRAIEKVTGKDAMIKWVNDIYIENRKVCGILTEASIDSISGILRYAVIGIGVNVFSPKEGFPEDISDKAGYLFSEGSENVRTDIIAEILNNFMEFYPALNKNDFLEDYRTHSLLKNRTVKVLGSAEERIATALDIDDDFRLVVKFPDGSTEALFHGDVSLVIQ